MRHAHVCSPKRPTCARTRTHAATTARRVTAPTTASTHVDYACDPPCTTNRRRMCDATAQPEGARAAGVPTVGGTRFAARSLSAGRATVCSGGVYPPDVVLLLLDGSHGYYNTYYSGDDDDDDDDDGGGGYYYYYDYDDYYYDYYYTHYNYSQ